MTPEELEALFASRSPRSRAGTGFDGQDAEGTPAEEEKAWRVARLKEALVHAQQLWLSGSGEIDLLAEKLADGSRDDTWRIPIGESGLLDFFLNILTIRGLRQPLKIHVLRLVGNSCADTDENRARVVSANYIPSIVSLLNDDSTLAFVIPVLYNVCVDYEPAQQEACKAGLSRALVQIISGPRLLQCQAFLNIICEILGLLVTQASEPVLADPATAIYLLNLATNPVVPIDAEDFGALVSVAVSYLAFEGPQQELVRRGAVPLLITACGDWCTRFDPASQADDAEGEARLRRVRGGFLQVVADVTAQPGFAALYPLNHPVVQTLQSWLRRGAGGFGLSFGDTLETAACLALGNMSRSDEASHYFVQEAHIHLPLASLLARSSSSSSSSSSNGGGSGMTNSAADGSATPPPPASQLQHAVLSFLKNLAIPAANKPILGDVLFGSNQVLPRLWASTDTQPQTQFAAVSLTRLLLVGCPHNVRAVCAPLSADPSSPAHERSHLHVLAALFGRVDAEPTKLEAARAVAAVCRVLHTPLPGSGGAGGISGGSSSSSSAMATILPEGDEGQSRGGSPTKASPTATTAATDADARSSPGQTRRARFYAAHLDIADSLTYLITQQRYPALRSEAWFVAALMSRAPDGARIVARALQPFEACRALVEAVTGRDMLDGHELLRTTAATSTTTTASTSATANNSPAGVEMDEEFKAGLLQQQEMRGGSYSPSSVAAPGQGAGSGTRASISAPTDAIEGLGLEPQQADPAQAASMARIDRENGLVLIAGMLKNYADYLPPFRRSVFEELLRTGGELVLHERGKREEDGGLAITA